MEYFLTVILETRHVTYIKYLRFYWIQSSPDTSNINMFNLYLSVMLIFYFLLSFFMQNISNALQFSYLIVAGAIDWNICPEVLGMTKGQMFQSIAPATIK